MKVKTLLAITLLVALAVLGSSPLYAEEKAPTPEEQMKDLPDKPVQAPGIILIDATDSSKVVLLTQVAVPGGDPQNPKTQMIGIPLKLDENGKKIVEEFGIVGISPDEPNGMERIQKESDTKSVLVDGVINFATGKPTLILKNYISAAEYMAQMKAKQEEDSAAAAAALEDTPSK